MLDKKKQIGLVSMLGASIG